MWLFGYLDAHAIYAWYNWIATVLPFEKLCKPSSTMMSNCHISKVPLFLTTWYTCTYRVQRSHTLYGMGQQVTTHTHLFYFSSQKRYFYLHLHHRLKGDHNLWLTARKSITPSVIRLTTQAFVSVAQLSIIKKWFKHLVEKNKTKLS